MKCPKCGSDNIELNFYEGAKCVTCNDCGYDSRDEVDVFPEEKTNQKEKGRYCKYKAGR